MRSQSAYTGTIARSIAAEMADHARDRGEGMTYAEYKRLGYTDEQIVRNAPQAAILYAQHSIRRIA
jgi:hypothetical protein